jgi:threonylcarbamoyladenosine tRNA methylthiotransferase MtaB
MSAPEVITFGCRLNSYESEVMKRQAEAAGIDNAIIFNTCAVTAEATRQARQAIRKARRANPDARIIVTGCAAQTAPGQFAAMPEVDQIFGNTEKMELKPYIDFGLGQAEKVQVNDIMSVRETAGHLIEGFEGRARTFVQIQNGCDHRCTFCIIPFGRGNSRSVPVGEIIDQVKRLVDNGYAEVVLTGVDITSFGADLPGAPSLGQLCEKLLRLVPDLKRLRLSSIDSIEIDAALFDVITGDPRLMPHLHLSLQAGDDMILKRMKRRHNRAQSVDFVERVLARRPDMVFGADLIAGFPTEDEEMFKNTLALIDDCQLTYLHVFPYSEREGTPAALMPQVAKTIRKARAAALRAAGDRRLEAFLKAQVGARVEVLVEKDMEGGGSLGHTAQFAPVTLDRAVPSGQIVTARITGANSNMLSGVIAS